MTFPLVCAAAAALFIVLFVAAFAAGRAVGYVAGIKYADGYLRRRINGGSDR